MRQLSIVLTAAALAAAAAADGASLLPVRDAWWYVPWQPMQAEGQPTLGTTAFRQPNPEFGATFIHAPSMHLRSWNFTGGADG